MDILKQKSMLSPVKAWSKPPRVTHLYIELLRNSRCFCPNLMVRGNLSFHAWVNSSLSTTSSKRVITKFTFYAMLAVPMTSLCWWFPHLNWDRQPAFTLHWFETYSSLLGIRLFVYSEYILWDRRRAMDSLNMPSGWDDQGSFPLQNKRNFHDSSANNRRICLERFSFLHSPSRVAYSFWLRQA